jgi:adenylyl- and sulfurtransferase ThiI
MNLPVSTTPPDALLVRYGELALKRGNRFEFEQALAALEQVGRELAPLGR